MCVQLEQVPATAITWCFILNDSAILWPWLFVRDYFRKARKFWDRWPDRLRWTTETREFQRTKKFWPLLILSNIAYVKYNSYACVCKQNYNYILSINELLFSIITPEFTRMWIQLLQAYKDNRPFQATPSNRRLIWEIQDLLEVSLICYHYLPQLEENNLICPSSRLSLRTILSGFHYTNLNTTLGMWRLVQMMSSNKNYKLMWFHHTQDFKTFVNNPHCPPLFCQYFHRLWP